MIKITSTINPEIKNIIKLRKSKERKEQDLVVVEGRHEINMAISAGIKIEKLFISNDFSSDDNFVVKAAEEIEVSREVFEKISSRENPDGYMALARVKKMDLKDIKLKKEPIVMILDGVEKPGNIGAILRTVDAVNADAVLICNSLNDPYNPNTIRASLGTVFTNQVVLSSMENVLLWLKNNGFVIFVTTPHSDVCYTKKDYRCPTAVVIGAEHKGVSGFWEKNGAISVKIPMFGEIDSLNASVSAGIFLYEILRQRMVD